MAIRSKLRRLEQGTRRWIPLALPVGMAWLLYANVNAFCAYQGSSPPPVDMYDLVYFPLKVHDPDPPAGWRPLGSSHRDYYWLQDVLRGTTLVMPRNVEINLGLWRHLALVNPVYGTHRRIDSALAQKLANGANFVDFSGTNPWWAPGQPRMLAGRIYFPESFESIRGKRAYWVVEKSRPHKQARRRAFVLSETLFERCCSSPR